MKKSLIKSGCRNSKLSLVQTEKALSSIQADLPQLEFQIIGLQSFGDKNKTILLDSADAPEDIWTRELDEKLLNNEIDIAVHSAKDLPPTLNKDIDFFWLPWSEEPGDVLILRVGEHLNNLPPKPIAAVSSDRRSIYVKEKFPNAILKPIRGTIEERIAQLDKGDFDILLMAEAALNRLHLQDRITFKIPLSDLPSPEGQGKIAITFKKKNKIGTLIRDLYIHPVSFVGAGPGDPDLLTIKGMKAIAKADCILYDALANPAILDYASPKAEKIFVGKRSGEHSLRQDKITELIVTKVKQGKNVLRLKGGDPSIFGRLSEEVQELKAENIPYRVIPGISALNGVTIAAGLLLTARGINQSFLTATATTEVLEKDYLKQYASIKQPVVFFMGLKQLENIVSEYLNKGWSPNTFVAVISEVYGVKVARGTLLDILEKVVVAKIPSPALIAIGDFASEKNDIRSTNNILSECRILLPGVKESVQHLSEDVESKGGTPIPWPMVQLSLCKEFLHHFNSISKYNLIVLASPASVRFLFEAVQINKLEFAKDVEFAVTGPGTATELQKFGWFPKYIPDSDYSSLGLIEKFKEFNIPGKIVLMPRSNIGGKEIENYLSNITAVTSVVLYNNEVIIPEKNLPDFDAILFTSPSGIKHFVDTYHAKALKNKLVAVIGNVTANEARKHNITISIIAKESTSIGLVNALASVIQNKKFK
jgi:uroporphyrinogen III methyltransferase/synthase